MKALILSDIHSNIYALEAIWKQERDSDLILCAGDHIDYGPFPRQTLDWIYAHNARSVQGNHDAWLALNYRRGMIGESVPEAERAWVNHNAALLEEADIRFLESLPRALAFDLNGVSYGMTHMYREYNEIVSLHAYEAFREELFGSATPPRLIMGHTHRQCVRYLADDLLWLNPGSASYRRKDDPDQSAHYATITDGRISLKRLEYDMTPLRRFMQTARLSEGELQVARFYFR